MKYQYFLFIIGLALTGNAFGQTASNDDPYQDFNRHMYAFNDGIDHAVLKPISTVYQTILPSPARTGVTNFFNNLDMIPTIVNDAFQGNSYNAGRDTWRFLINSTIGIAGLFDVAKHMNLPPHHEDFGLTLGKWGYQNSNYLVLPLLGPSTVRDAIGLPTDYGTSIYPYTSDKINYTLNGINIVNQRANLLNYDSLLHQAFDPYTAVKNGYLQQRNSGINRD